MNAVRIVIAILFLSSTLLTSSAQNRTFQVDVDLVLINASVMDSNSRTVTGLRNENFQIWEDKVLQKIDYFSSEELPISVGIIFDVSGSMAPIMPLARAAVVTFLRMGNRDDEYFLVQFSNRAQLVRDFTSNTSDLELSIAMTSAHGSTALYDALYLGMDQVSRGRNPRKALIVISDGLDNRSRYSFAAVKEMAKEKDIQIYAIGLTDWQYRQQVNATAILGDLAKTTGGRAYFPNYPRELEGICQKIGMDLKSQYMLGYRSTNPIKDGKWRKVKVKMASTKGLNVRARTGYYAPAVVRASK